MSLFTKIHVDDKKMFVVSARKIPKYRLSLGLSSVPPALSSLFHKNSGLHVCIYAGKTVTMSVGFILFLIEWNNTYWIQLDWLVIESQNGQRPWRNATVAAMKRLGDRYYASFFKFQIYICTISRNIKESPPNYTLWGWCLAFSLFVKTNSAYKCVVCSMLVYFTRRKCQC